MLLIVVKTQTLWSRATQACRAPALVRARVRQRRIRERWSIAGGVIIIIIRLTMRGCCPPPSLSAPQTRQTFVSHVWAQSVRKRNMLLTVSTLLLLLFFSSGTDTHSRSQHFKGFSVFSHQNFQSFSGFRGAQRLRRRSAHSLERSGPTLSVCKVAQI